MESTPQQPSREDGRAGSSQMLSSDEQHRSLSSQTASPERQGSAGQQSQADTAPTPPATLTCTETSQSQQYVMGSDEIRWLQSIKEWYPHRHEQTYFLPPLFFRRVRYNVQSFCRLVILIPEPFQGRKTPGPKKKYRTATDPSAAPPTQGLAFDAPRGDPVSLPSVKTSAHVDDDATERVLECLRDLSEVAREVMMVISPLDFENYLGNSTQINDLFSFRRPADMAERENRKGDFDVLIIHRDLGVIACEVKGVGADREKIPDLKKAVKDKVLVAIEQLNKSNAVLRHIMSDIGPINVTKVLMLPNITSDELSEALRDDMDLQNLLCECLGVQELSSAINLTLCRDKMPFRSAGQDNSSSHATTIDPLKQWWSDIKPRGPDQHMSDTVYDTLLARFCGPATKVEIPTVTKQREIRTTGQAAAVTGSLLSLLVLYRDQFKLLSDVAQCVHLYGPPGSGKTVVLVIKALLWLMKKRKVHVISFYEDSRAVSKLIKHHLKYLTDQDLASDDSPNIISTVIGPPPFDAAIQALADAASAGELYIIADEVATCSYNGDPMSILSTSDFEQFINALHDKLPSVTVWCASMPRLTGRLPWMHEKELTISLRSPPAVTREVAKSKGLGADIPFYTPGHAPTDGLNPIFLEHKKTSRGFSCFGDTTGTIKHKSGSAFTCDGCGQALVNELNKLDVGKENGTDWLQYRDVIILVTNNIMKGQDFKRPSTKGIVAALRASGFPVKVLKQGYYNDEDLRDVALALTDQITVTNYQVASGLERKVVIGMGTQAKCKEMYNRLFGMSRCTAKLIWIGTVTEG